MRSSWPFSRDGSIRCLVDSWDSTFQADFVVGTLFDTSSLATVSCEQVRLFVFLHGMAASICTSNCAFEFSYGFFDFFVFQIKKVNACRSASILEFWLLVRPLLFLAFLSGFTNLGPYFRPHMIWSRSRLNFCQSPPGPKKKPLEEVFLWIEWSFVNSVQESDKLLFVSTFQSSSIRFSCITSRSVWVNLAARTYLSGIRNVSSFGTQVEIDAQYDDDKWSHLE